MKRFQRNIIEKDVEDYEILEFILKTTKPEIVTLEYGGFKIIFHGVVIKLL